MSPPRTLNAIRRVAFTVALALAILAATLWIRGPDGRYAPEALRHWGFALHDVWDLEAWSLVTAVFLSPHPQRVGGTILFLFLTVGLYEWRAGTRRAFAAFWLGDVLASLLVALGILLPLYLGGTAAGIRMAFADDVGMSGGGFTCLGAWIGGLSRRTRDMAFVVAGGYLVYGLIAPPLRMADLLHVAAFLLGLALEVRYRAPVPSMETPA